MRRRDLGVVLALVAQVAALPAAAAPSLCDKGPAKFDVAKVMEAARKPKQSLVLLSAHRGYWRTGAGQLQAVALGVLGQLGQRSG